METPDSDKKMASGYDQDFSPAIKDVREGSMKLVESEVFTAGEDGVDF
jgi:hypothetical protein